MAMALEMVLLLLLLLLAATTTYLGILSTSLSTTFIFPLLFDFMELAIKCTYAFLFASVLFKRTGYLIA
jgi:hypothetical protein